MGISKQTRRPMHGLNGQISNDGLSSAGFHALLSLRLNKQVPTSYSYTQSYVVRRTVDARVERCALVLTILEVTQRSCSITLSAAKGAVATDLCAANYVVTYLLSK